MKIYNIKEDKKDELFEYIRQLIIVQCKYENSIAISNNIGIYNVNNCSNDIYGFNFDRNNNGTKCINITVYQNCKSTFDNPKPLIVDNGYKYYSNLTIKLSNFLNNNPKWSNISDWTEPNKEKCKYATTSSLNKTCGFRRPDNKEYILDIPNEVLDNGRVVGSSNPSAPINVWIKSMEESLTTKYYRDLAIDDLYDIKRNQTTYADGIWFEYDYNNGLVEVFGIHEYKNNLISKKMIELGLINVDSLSNNNKVIKEIEKSLFERHDKELKVNNIKIILSDRNDKIKI